MHEARAAHLPALWARGREPLEQNSNKELSRLLPASTSTSARIFSTFNRRELEVRVAIATCCHLVGTKKTQTGLHTGGVSSPGRAALNVDKVRAMSCQTDCRRRFCCADLAVWYLNPPEYTHRRTLPTANFDAGAADTEVPRCTVDYWPSSFCSTVPHDVTTG